MSTPFEFLNSTIRVAPGRRVIPAEDYQQFTQAQNLLNEAKQEAELIKQRAQKEYEAQRLQGYKDGLSQADDEKAAFCMQTAQDFSNVLEEIETKLGALLPQIIRNFLGDLGEETSFQAYVSRALQELVSEEKLTIKAHPSKRRQLEDLVEQLKQQESNFTRFIRVAGDNTLEVDQATIETQSSIVVLDLSRQLHLLEKYAQSRLTEMAQESGLDFEKIESNLQDAMKDENLLFTQPHRPELQDDSVSAMAQAVASEVERELESNELDEEEIPFRVYE